MATPICFEDTVAPLCRRMIYDGGEKIAHILINLSNDGWFGDEDGGRAQHLQIARFRCIENRVPMVRAVNTGLSASIDSTGRIDASERNGDAPPAVRTPGTIAATVQIDSRRSWYGTLLGDVVGWVCLGSTVVMLLGSLMRRQLHKG
jgi:apolipoprotein N-acyltransferase